MAMHRMPARDVRANATDPAGGRSTEDLADALVIGLPRTRRGSAGPELLQPGSPRDPELDEPVLAD